MMKRWLAFLALSYLLTFILMACGRVGTSAPAGSGTAGTAPPAALGAEVHMNSANFVQTEITIQKGQSVRLINDDPITPHIIANGTWVNGTAKPTGGPNAPEVRNVQINGNTQATIGPFTTAGTFKFYCTIHPAMNLTVMVRPGQS
jgi:plastocyanin